MFELCTRLHRSGPYDGKHYAALLAETKWLLRRTCSDLMPSCGHKAAAYVAKDEIRKLVEVEYRGIIHVAVRHNAWMLFVIT